VGVKDKKWRTILKDASVPVVVFISPHHGTLGVTRSLGRLGVEVYGIDPNSWSPSLHSRYCRGKFIWNPDTASPEATVQCLLDVARKIGKRSILLHTHDEGAILLADYADVLSEWYIFPHVSPQVVRSLISKKEMYFTARKYDVPTPEACFPQSREELIEYLNHAAFPIMLKAIDGRMLERRSGWRMSITTTKEGLLDLYDRYNDPLNPTFMLQEYIPGGEDSIWMFNGYFDGRSECLFGITGKKIRQAPPYTGATSLGICLRNDSVEETTKRFLKAIGYKGIVDIGYRYDKRDGNYKVLDINPRIGSTFRLFLGSDGLDVARAEYLDLTGQSVPSNIIIEGRKWLVEDADLFSSMRYYRDGNLRLGQWLRSYYGVNETAWFSWGDPFPFFIVLAKFLREVVSHRMRLLFKNIRKLLKIHMSIE
jgi:D-aspartate ligase